MRRLTQQWVRLETSRAIDQVILTECLSPWEASKPLEGYSFLAVSPRKHTFAPADCVTSSRLRRSLCPIQKCLPGVCTPQHAEKVLEQIALLANQGGVKKKKVSYLPV